MNGFTSTPNFRHLNIGNMRHQLKGEASTTISLENAALLLFKYGRPARLDFKADVQKVEYSVTAFWDTACSCFTFLGFAWGYGGTGPAGLGEFLQMCGIKDLTPGTVPIDKKGKSDSSYFLKGPVTASPIPANAKKLSEEALRADVFNPNETDEEYARRRAAELGVALTVSCKASETLPISEAAQAVTAAWEELGQEEASLSAAGDISDNAQREQHAQFYKRTVAQAQAKFDASVKALVMSLQEEGWLDKADSLPALCTAFEYGFRLCEKGMNLERALETFRGLMQANIDLTICPRDKGAHTWAHPGTSKNPTHCAKCNTPAAEFQPNRRRFWVSVKPGDKKRISERMTIAKFIRWARALDAAKPMVINGITIKADNPADEQMTQVRTYFKQVANSYVASHWKKGEDKDINSIHIDDPHGPEKN